MSQFFSCLETVNMLYYSVKMLYITIILQGRILLSISFAYVQFYRQSQSFTQSQIIAMFVNVEI
jgi:hypothetical protein